MADLTISIPRLRESVAAILRLHMTRKEAVKKGKVRPAQFQASLSGTAVCVVADRYLLTAFHILNGGQPRDAQDRFYAFTVPRNGGLAYHFPVIGFPLERADVDLAILEVGPSAIAGPQIPAAPVSFSPQPDGTRVITIGFPAPEIEGMTLDPHGNYMGGGQFFLKSHANEGIVAAQYDVGAHWLYELNVGWHHGESGGPIATAADHPAVFSLMQHYRQIQSPHGVLPGPRRGVALSAVQAELLALGVTVT
jgi:trypsin-like peptidase